MNVGCVSRGRAHQTAIQEYVGSVFCVLIYFVDEMVFYASVKDDILVLLL